MADKSTQLLLDALNRAVAEPAGVPLHGNKKTPGLFAASATGRQLAERCKQEGLLRTLQTQARGKRLLEICTVTEKGLSYLLSQVSPKQALEELVRALSARQHQVEALVQTAQEWHAGLANLRAAVARILQQIQQPSGSGPTPSANGAEAWLAEVVAYLSQWQAAGATGDCPLPDLYRQAQRLTPKLTIGQFHDGLRKLHGQEKLYLHPWTGPLYDIPEPQCALLVGHEIAYYASFRVTG